MADFNQQLIALQHKSARMQTDLVALLKDYEGLFHEANGVFISQKMASGTDGLEEFHKFLLIIRRNRDLIGSLIQGSKGLRPTGHFRFIEEEFSQEKRKETPAQIRSKKKKSQAQTAAPVEFKDIEAPEPEVVNG